MQRDFDTVMGRTCTPPLKITAHKDFRALERYVEIDSDRVKGAIANYENSFISPTSTTD